MLISGIKSVFLPFLDNIDSNLASKVIISFSKMNSKIPLIKKNRKKKYFPTLYEHQNDTLE